MSKTTTALPAAVTAGAEVTRFNALRHGVLSKYTVLPWEDGEEYQALVGALVTEHAPQGPTEEHLVEEIAGIFWRKRRLRLAEGALNRRGLTATLPPYRDTVKSALVYADSSGQTENVADALAHSADQTREHIEDMEADEAMTRKALAILGSRRNDAYEAALKALRDDTLGWWTRLLEPEADELDEGETLFVADPDGLRRFLEDKVLPWYEDRRREFANRPLIREQAFGEALDPNKLESLGRYEVHLDRKLERMLGMLLRLKDLRQGAVAG
jgi:hypothetical protein